MADQGPKCCCENCCAVTPELLRGLADFAAGRVVSADWLLTDDDA